MSPAAKKLRGLQGLVSRAWHAATLPRGRCPVTPELYHFTCRDGHRMIGRYNCVLTPRQGAWPVVWLTDEAGPDFEALGLGDPVILKCDRREFRYIVAAGSSCRQWLGSPERAALDADHRAVLEEYAKPEHWWISAGPVRATWDRSWQRERVP